MIRINLLGEKVDNTVRNFLHTSAYLAAVFVAVLGCFIVNTSLNTDLEERNQEQARLKRRLAELEKITREIDDLEKNKKTLQEKLQTIATLKARKKGPVNVLDSINSALPERAWLTSLKEKNGAVELQGVALDNQTVSAFISNLEQYPYFQSVELGLTANFVKDEIDLKQFTLTIGLRGALDVEKAESDKKGEDKKKKGA